MDAPKKVFDLIEHFERNYNHYKSHHYNETQLRREFLDPFFIALGWDVHNESGTYDAYKDVIHEDAIKIGSCTKAPDYCFRVGGIRKFFVEAKKPAVNIHDDATPAYQLRRYAWSAKLPLSILTDFEEFAVYDCRIKPNIGDKSSVARTLFFTFQEYVPKWEEIASIFSKEAVWKGELDKYADTKKLKRGTAAVDDAFLDEIENWRLLLARNFALRNESLTQRQLNYVVQKTIDRIVFLRICEDRSIEQYGRLQILLNGANVYPRLCQLFQQADDKYNSGLFHFKTEKEQTSDPDNLSLNLNVDDKVLKEIIKKLYYPDSPYEFSVLPADILGQVYEQFLGKVIRLTAGHQAKIEEKPEVKKAGGVYYTPTYIVEYIVKNTVEKLLEGKTPIKVSELKILDPACGSGSFLIVAYQRLLDWHLNWYLQNLVPLLKEGKSLSSKAVKDLLPEIPETDQKKRKAAPYMPVIELAPNDWRLTTAERKRILLNNIFGVDIDSQAVEVTKLSLLLKVLESENEQTLTPQLSLFQERALPDLANNIKCGNSLIGTDYCTSQLIMLDDDERIKVNAFDWQYEFSEIMKRGGFDAVIGNPPYVRQESLGDNKAYFKTHYKVFHGIADLYTYFIERGVTLLRDGGYFSYIVANKWMRANYGEPLRKWLKEQVIEELVDFGDLPVFKSATTYPCIIRILKSREVKDSFNAARIPSLDFVDLTECKTSNSFPVYLRYLDNSGWSLIDEKSQKLLDKLRATGIPLGEYVHGKIFRGILTGLNEAFVIDSATKDRLISEDPKSGELIKPFLLGRDIKRYEPPKSNRFLIFTRRGVDIKKYPAIECHLNQFKERLMPRPSNYKGADWPGRKPGSYEWYEIQDTIDYYKEFEKTKIILPDISLRGNMTLDNDNNYSVNTTYIIASSEEYLLSVLNSKLITFYYTNKSSTYRGGYLRWIFQYISQLPIIKKEAIQNPNLYNALEYHAKLMFEYSEKIALAQLINDKIFFQRQIDATDRMIDQLVYELYGLTDAEIKIVEEST